VRGLSPRAAALALCVAAAALCALQPTPPGAPVAGLRVAAANLYVGNRAPPAELEAALAAVRADALLLLEWRGGPAPAGLVIAAEDPDPGVRGVALALRPGVRAAAAIEREAGQGPCAMPGVAAQLEGALPGASGITQSDVALIGAHAPPPVPGCGGATGPSLARIGAWVAGGRSRGAPPPVPDGLAVVLLGDLNTLPFHPDLRPLRAAGLRDALLRGDLRPRPTWPQLPGRVAVGRIDHVYVSDEIEVLDSGTFEIPGSDHRGVWADLAARR
jgi:hypothetical protein